MAKFFRIKYRELRRAFLYRNPIAGKIVELMGNKGKISGMTFDLDNPYIATFLKCRFLFKTYEDGAEQLISDYVDPELPVVEFGGCIGVISCLTNRQLCNKQEHVVIEAQPHLIKTLVENRNQNHCEFTVINAALAYGADEVEFWINPSFFIGNRIGAKAGTGGEIVKVPGRTLKSVLDEFNYDKISLVVDIEGAELELIENELDVIAEHVETLIIELHAQNWGAGVDGVGKIKNDLIESGFVISQQAGSDFVFENKRHKDSRKTKLDLTCT